MEGIVISWLEFFLWGEEGIVFVAPGFWVDGAVLRIMRMGSFSASVEGRGWLGFELAIQAYVPSFAVFPQKKAGHCFES